MAIPVVQSKSEQKEPAATTTSTITAPTGIVDGNVLTIVLCTDGDMPAASITWPTGFTPIAEVNNGTVCSASAAYKIASSESGDYTVSWTASEQAILWMYRVDGAISGDEIQNPNESSTGTTSPATITPVASTDTDDSLVFVVAGMDDDDITEDGGGDADYTVQDVDRSNTGNGTGSGGVQTKGIATAAVPPQCDLTLTADEQWATFWFAVRSIAPAGETKAFNETADLAEAMSRKLSLKRSVGEPADLAEAFTKGMGKSVAETADLDEALSTSRGYKRTFGEAL